MKQLDERLFQVLAKTRSINSFEQWLYADESIHEQVLINPFVLDLLQIDFKAKEAQYLLNKLCRQRFNQEEILVQIVKYNCEVLLERKSDKAIDVYFENILMYPDWDSDYHLISQIYFNSEDWHLLLDGFGEKRLVKNEIFNTAKEIVIILNESNMAESIRLLENGLAPKSDNTIEQTLRKRNRWCDFFKNLFIYAK